MAGLGFGTALAIGRGGMITRPGFVLDGATLPPGATLRRASGASCHDATGALISVPADTARVDHDPITGAVHGLLIEPAATNLLSWSDGTVAQLDLSSGVTNAPGTIPGFANAVYFSGEAATCYAYKKYTSALAQTLTLSVIVRMDDGGPPSVSSTKSTGDFSLLVGSQVVDGPVTVLPETGRAYRCIATGVMSTTQANCGVVRYATQSARGFRLTGMQLEEGAQATSYIATAESAATRAADVLMLDWSALGVADAEIVVRYRFDEGGEAMIPTSLAGGIAAVPTPLARPWLRRAERW